MIATDFPVQVAATHGRVPPELLPRAEEMVRRVAHTAPAPVLFARVAIAHDEDPAVERRVVAKATLDVNGHPVRGHVAAEHFDEAVDLLQARLRHGLEVLAEHRLARRSDSGDSGPGEWRHGDLPSHRPAHFPRPPEERELVVRKSYALADETIEEAATDLELLDHDWMLFTELQTGQDAVLVRSDGTYRLLLAGADEPDIALLPFPVVVDRQAPTLVLSEATQMLELGGAPFVFFVDADNGRGAVVYLRYDGHVGMVVPAVRSRAGMAA